MTGASHCRPWVSSPAVCPTSGKIGQILVLAPFAIFALTLCSVRSSLQTERSSKSPMKIRALIGEPGTAHKPRSNTREVKRSADCTSSSTSKTSGLRIRRKVNRTGHSKCSRSAKRSTRIKRRGSSGGSSGHSSPQTPCSSASLFSNRSSSGSSPLSSHSSFSDGSPSPPSTHYRSQPRIQISSLLSEPYAVTYHLEVVQHPARAAEFRDAPLSRLPITPPVIVRLIIRDSSGNLVVPNAELPFLIAHLSLYTENGQTRLDSGPAIGANALGPILYGNLVSSVAHFEDLQGNRGLFFVFPDVSIRWCGRYQLGVTLLRLSDVTSRGVLSNAHQTTGLAETRTRAFDVLPRHQYTALPQTRLTQSFMRQGARMFTFIPPHHP